MAHVQFTRHLLRYFPELEQVQIRAATVAELVAELDRRHPGLAGYLVDDRGALRQHVNIFVDEEMLRDRLGLSDELDPTSKVYVMQALSGG